MNFMIFVIFFSSDGNYLSAVILVATLNHSLLQLLQKENRTTQIQS